MIKFKFLFMLLFLLFLTFSVYGEESQYELLSYNNSLYYLNISTREITPANALPGGITYELEGEIPQLTDYEYKPFYMRDITGDRELILLANKHKPEDYQLIERDSNYSYFQIKRKFLCVDPGEISCNPSDLSFNYREGDFYILDVDSGGKKEIEGFWEKAVKPLTEETKKAIEKSTPGGSLRITVRDSFLLESRLFLVIDYSIKENEGGDQRSLQKKLILLDLNSCEVKVKEEKFLNYISSYRIDNKTVCFTGEKDIIKYDLSTGKSKGFLHRLKLEAESSFIMPLNYKNNKFYIAVRGVAGKSNLFDIYSIDFYYYEIEKIYTSQSLGQSPLCYYQKDRFIILYNPHEAYCGIKGITMSGKDLFKIQEKDQIEGAYVMEDKSLIIVKSDSAGNKDFIFLGDGAKKTEKITEK